MKRFLAFSAWLVVLGFLAPAPPCRAAGLIIVDEAHWWPGPHPPHPMPPAWPPRPLPPAALPLRAAGGRIITKVNVRITDQIAVTSVDQEFYNPNPHPARRHVRLSRSQRRAHRQVHDGDRRQTGRSRAAARRQGARDLRGHRAQAQRPGAARIRRARRVQGPHLSHRAEQQEAHHALLHRSCSRPTTAW